MCFLSKEERAKRKAAKLRAKQEKLAKKKGHKVEPKKIEATEKTKREPIRVQEGNTVNRPEQKPVVQKVEPKEPKKETTVSKAEPKKETPKKEASKAEEKAAPQEKAKSTKKIYHISYRKEDNQWQVKLGGAKVLKLFKTQEEGIQYAKQLAGNQEGSIVIHMKDGTIRKQKY